MAEAILFDIAGEILMKLSSQAFQRLGMLFGLKDNLNKLTATVSTIKDVLLDAEGRQTKGHLLENWLQKLEEALYDAEDVLDELSTEALHREVMTEWIGILTSLEELEIMECPKLKSLPEGMQKLESLRSFLIGGCPEVEERCKQGGEDWAKIAHIPHFEQFLLDN